MHLVHIDVLAVTIKSCSSRPGSSKANAIHVSPQLCLLSIFNDLHGCTPALGRQAPTCVRACCMSTVRHELAQFLCPTRTAITTAEGARKAVGAELFFTPRTSRLCFRETFFAAD